MAQTQEGTSRQIVLEEFMRGRPAKSAETPPAVSNSKAQTRKRPPPLQSRNQTAYISSREWRGLAALRFF